MGTNRHGQTFDPLDRSLFMNANRVGPVETGPEGDDMIQVQSRNSSIRLRCVVFGLAALVGLVAIPRLAGASPSYVPSSLRAEHMKLPSRIRRKVEVHYYKLRQFRDYLKRGDEPRAKNALAEAKTWWLNALQAAGPDPYTSYPIFKKYRQALVKARASMAAGLAAVEKIGCPKDKYRNAGLKRAIKKALLNSFDRKDCQKRGLPSQRRECEAIKENLRKYSLAGRPTTKYNAYRRTYTKRLMVWACVKQKPRGKKEVCRAFNLSVQQTKRRGGRWSPWKVYGVGSVQRIGCRKLR